MRNLIVSTFLTLDGVMQAPGGPEEDPSGDELLNPASALPTVFRKTAQETSAEIEASRARIVAAADEARRRLERDLHDGAQQQLVAAAMTLKQAEEHARGTRAEPLVTDALEQLREALTELRDLARGIHPAVLSERGLAAALQGLAARSPVPVELGASGARAAPAAEAAIYFTVAEALTNAAKHAQASHVGVLVDVQDGMLHAQVIDDGVGGASVTSGSGLRGLADRLAALGGTLTIQSPSGGGTSIRARLPVNPGSSRAEGFGLRASPARS